LFLLLIPSPPCSPLFPYTTLFRSGDVGGLARAARNTIRVLDAAGMDVVIVETVGAGQTEVQVATAVDATVVVLMPQLGDEVQALDRKSTRLNSSHEWISYAVFCLK